MGLGSEWHKSGSTWSKCSTMYLTETHLSWWCSVSTKQVMHWVREAMLRKEQVKDAFWSAPPGRWATRNGDYLAVRLPKAIEYREVSAVDASKIANFLKINSALLEFSVVEWQQDHRDMPSSLARFQNLSVGNFCCVIEPKWPRRMILYGFKICCWNLSTGFRLL